MCVPMATWREVQNGQQWCKANKSGSGMGIHMSIMFHIWFNLFTIIRSSDDRTLTKNSENSPHKTQ